MPDQLFLDLAAAAPRLPRSLSPMLARPAPEPFDSAEHLFEPTWGGHRALAFVEPDASTGALTVRFVDADGRDVTAAFPDLAALPDALAAPFAILDGELVVPDGSGHADDGALASRLSTLAVSRTRTRPRAPGGRRAPSEPAVFLAFDLLYSDGRLLVGQPLTRRRQLLRSLVTPGADLLVVPAVPGDGRALFEAAVEQRLPGILARHVRAPYLAGRRSVLWQSISTEGRTTADPADTDAEASPEPSADDAGPRRPVLALIRRLPLPLDDE